MCVPTYKRRRVLFIVIQQRRRGGFCVYNSCRPDVQLELDSAGRQGDTDAGLASNCTRTLIDIVRMCVPTYKRRRVIFIVIQQRRRGGFCVQFQLTQPQQQQQQQFQLQQQQLQYQHSYRLQRQPQQQQQLLQSQYPYQQQNQQQQHHQQLYHAGASSMTGQFHGANNNRSRGFTLLDMQQAMDYGSSVLPASLIATAGQQR